MNTATRPYFYNRAVAVERPIRLAVLSRGSLLAGTFHTFTLRESSLCIYMLAVIA